MRLPVNTRSAHGYHDIQSDIDDKEIPRQIDFSENPQAQQRAQDCRYRARCADREVWAGMRNVADDPTEDEAAEINQGEIERLHPPFQKSAPKYQAKHVSEQVNGIGMKKPIRDEPPIFMAVERLGIHRAVPKQHFARKARAARLRHTKREDEDVDAEQQLRHPVRDIKKTFGAIRHSYRDSLSIDTSLRSPNQL